MKQRTIILLLVLVFVVGCQPIENTARDSIAAAKGYIQGNQETHWDSCTADPAQAKCVAINKAVAAQNLAIDALKVYCSGGDFLNGGPCTPNKDKESLLRQTLAQLDTTITQVKVLLGD